MKSVTRVRVEAPPERVWPWVAHPDGVMRWNPKLVEHAAPPPDRIRSGSRYRVTYRMRPEKDPVEVWAYRRIALP